ncbi:MAG: hypothetical protein JNL18_24190 [Planctomycetaceae bacterium]|nr:hypothetical protein [Planctomycetaceae bacterium]
MHFSLRTLLIATTAVAIYVGGSLGILRTLNAWQRGGALRPISFLFFSDLPLFVLWVFAAVWGYERRQRPGMNALLGGLGLTACWRFASPIVQTIIVRPSGASWEGAFSAFVIFNALIHTTIWALLLYAFVKASESRPAPVSPWEEPSPGDPHDR